MASSTGGYGSVPLMTVPEKLRRRLTEFGAPQWISDSNLYRALANHPSLLEGWIELAWRLRTDAATPRRLRELMILRGAQLMDCDYELRHHEEMALANGVSASELDQLAGWRNSSAFSQPERAALAFMEAMIDGRVPDPILSTLAEHFGPSERVELTVTAGLYCMVPRVIDAFRVPLEANRGETTSSTD